MSVFIAVATSMLTLIKYRYHMINLILETCPELHENPTRYFILTSITELFDVFFSTWIFVLGHIIYYFSCYHIISFMSLGLYKKEYQDLKHFFMKSLYLWVGSTYLFLKILLPLTFIFFFEFKQNSNCAHFKLYLEPKLDTYLIFTMNIYIQCYLTSQLVFILVFLINHTKTKPFVTNFKKPLYITILITATVITPPEIWNQITVFLFLTLSIEIYSIGNTFNNKLNFIKEHKVKTAKETMVELMKENKRCFQSVKLYPILG